MTLTFNIHPSQQPYYNLPLWADYMSAKARWESAHAEYMQNGSTAAFVQLNNTACEKATLLASLRETPEHVAAFGW